MLRASRMAIGVMVLVTMMAVGCDDGGGSSDGGGGGGGGGGGDATGPLTAEEVLLACIKQDACDIKPQGYLSQCVNSYFDPTSAMDRPVTEKIYRCLLGASDCTEVRQCYGNGELPEQCDPTTEKGSCEGDLAHVCDSFDKRMYVYDCSAAGMTCVVNSDGRPQCGEGSCDPDSYQPGCDGDRIVQCVDGVILLTDCTARGLECLTLTDDQGVTTPVCAKAGEPCDPKEYEEHCEGDTAYQCLYGAVADIECSRFEQVCTEGNGSATCTYPTTECQIEDEKCVDDFLAQFCIRGHLVTKDCRDLGFRRCVGKGINGNIGAHCSVN